MKVVIMDHTEHPERAIRNAMDVTRGNIDKAVDPAKDAKRFLNIATLGHWSVFEHASFTFFIEGVSRVTQQQLTRHRMASFSIESQRRSHVDYLNMIVPPPSVIHSPLISDWQSLIHQIVTFYDEMIRHGIPMEDARYILPGATTGDIIVTMNTRELYHFLKLRTAPSAQWEIRDLAGEMYRQLHDGWPEIFNLSIMSHAE